MQDAPGAGGGGGKIGHWRVGVGGEQKAVPSQALRLVKDRACSSAARRDEAGHFFCPNNTTRGLLCMIPFALMFPPHRHA